MSGSKLPYLEKYRNNRQSLLVDQLVYLLEFPVNWARGDGQGGSEEHIGTVTNAAECVVKCYSRKRNGKFANGATIDSATQKSCYCEYGQTGRNSASNWKNTFIRPRKYAIQLILKGSS